MNFLLTIDKINTPLNELIVFELKFANDEEGAGRIMQAFAPNFRLAKTSKYISGLEAQ